jgi:thiamine kinase-like enzyme
VSAAGLDAPVSTAITRELSSLQSICGATARPPRHLIAFDGHPGNFIVRDPVHRADNVQHDGGSQAVLVDLEKCRYSYPGLDLAHATLYTSTTWDMESHAVLSVRDVLSAYQTWAENMPEAPAIAALPWHVPLRRAMWLWSITWCAKWRVVSTTHSAATPDGEDWSEERSDEALIRHVRDRVDHYLSPSVVALVRDEFDQLDAALSRTA